MITAVEEAGISYSRQGVYLLPELKLNEKEYGEIGIWGQKCGRYLRKRHRIAYYNFSYILHALFPSYRC